MWSLLGAMLKAKGLHDSTWGVIFNSNLSYMWTYFNMLNWWPAWKLSEKGLLCLLLRIPSVW